MKTFFQSLELNSVDFLHCWIWLPINWNLGSFLLFWVRNIPRRYIFPGATYPPAPHTPRRYISPVLHIPWRYIFPGATYFPRYIFPSAFTYPSVLHIQNDKKFNTALGLIFFLETHIFGIFQKIVILHPSTPGWFLTSSTFIRL